MRYALTYGSRRVPAAPGVIAVCPLCGAVLQPKCGSVVSWHWAHRAGDCDRWAEPDSEWHQGWQRRVPGNQTEIVIGEHRADIVSVGGVVVELQHSGLSGDDIRAREDHYGHMIWIFDAIGPYRAGRLDIRRRNGYVTFRWKHPRKSVAQCRRRVYLDLGNELLYLNRIYTDAPCGGSGQLVDPAALVHWMTDRTLIRGEAV